MHSPASSWVETGNEPSELSMRYVRALSGCVVAMSLSATKTFAADEAKIDPADTTFMIVATALVLMMTIPGLALFYAGMVRKKNVLATMAQSVAATAVVSRRATSSYSSW